ncbi:hypothetical protein N7489_003286 [Penicillium chrysogenum]|uniref:uncharacterized protein n=1 Tax=Penicillium chrysogenum TaxID=5076 RepID=UPI0024DF26AB|nr:uncharacterized protein N7489_003286 [Penicillium chrysogenum]KAJ5252876.1 hypothetical protein N7489_003286 [Penicillium chrysogenum]
MQRAFPVKQRIPPLFALYTFLYAVGNNTACQNWLNSVTIHDEWSYDKNLQYFIGAFIASEGRRLLNDRQFSQQQASSNVASNDASADSNNKKKKKKDKSKDDKKDGDDNKKQGKKQYCPFQERETFHKPKDCFLNPKKKDKESANKAEAADKPAVAASASIENLWCSATFMVVNDAGIAVDINEFPTTSNPLYVSSAVIATDASHKRD